MNKTGDQPLWKKNILKKTVNWFACLGLLFWAAHAVAEDESMSEYQIKALFLLNFTKYVGWPADSFAGGGAPVIIGIYGEDRFGDALKKAVEGKSVSGRRIIIQTIATYDAMGKCNILFISDSEKNHTGDILYKIRGLPVLTVGESGQFVDQGGVINFVEKEGRIRLEINLDAAGQANLQISSKLLSVADLVKGKAR